MRHKTTTKQWFGFLWVLVFAIGVFCVITAPPASPADKQQLSALKQRYISYEESKPRPAAVALLNVTLITSAVFFGLALIRRKKRGYILKRTGAPSAPQGLVYVVYFICLWVFYTGLAASKVLGGGFGGLVLGDIFAKVLMLAVGVLLLGQTGKLKDVLGLKGGADALGRGAYIALVSLAPVWIVAFLWSGVAERYWGKEVNVLLAGFVGGIDGFLPAWTVLSVVVLACVVGPLAEEFLFRVVLFGGLRVAGFLPAVLLQAAIFGAMHTPQEALPITLLGIMLGYLYERTGSVYAVWLAHGLFNAHSLVLTWLQVM